MINNQFSDEEQEELDHFLRSANDMPDGYESKYYKLYEVGDEKVLNLL